MLPAVQDVNPFPGNRYVSTKQVAQAIGMSVTTVKRWVDEGVLPAHRTAGGHRKLLLADVLRFVREGKLPQVDLSSLFSNSTSVGLNDVAKYFEDLKAAAVSQDTEQIKSIILAAYQSGMTIVSLADDLIAPMMHFIGHQWESGDMEVLQEHRVTQAVVTALYELTRLLKLNPETNQPVAVGGAPEHDHYLLPTLLAKLILLEGGWDAINLGPHTPFSALTNSLEKLKPQLIWVTVSHLQNTEEFLREYKTFYREAEAMGVPVAIGGFGLHEQLRQQMPYTTYGDKLSQLSAFAKTLHSRPGQPRRGRPPITEPT